MKPQPPRRAGMRRLVGEPDGRSAATALVKDRLRAFNVAVAELEHQDLWQRAGLGVVTVAGSEALAERELRNVVDAIDAVEPGIVSRSDVEILT